MITEPANMQEDLVEDAFADKVLDTLFNQEGNQGPTYKAALSFMLDRRRLMDRLAGLEAEARSKKL